mgnify:CR=1 FL=1
MSVQEEKTIADTRVHVRGDVHNLGSQAPRGFLQVISLDYRPRFTNKQSGRLELGRWIAHRDNPLTARVLANRLWHWVFGSGLVRTTDNFGTTGELPSHPQLLDWIATEFHRNDWVVKALVRLIAGHSPIPATYAGGARSMTGVEAVIPVCPHEPGTTGEPACIPAKSSARCRSTRARKFSLRTRSIASRAYPCESSAIAASRDMARLCK